LEKIAHAEENTTVSAVQFGQDSGASLPFVCFEDKDAGPRQELFQVGKRLLLGGT